MVAKDRIVIFGAGGHGRVVLDILLESKQNVIGFIDDDKKKCGKDLHGFKVLGDFSCLKNKKYAKLALGIGDNKIRAGIFEKAKKMGLKIARTIHPKAVVAADVKIGEGVVIMPGAIVNTGVVLEDGVVVNTGATVDHDCCLKKFCQIWPGANLAGGVRVGGFSYVGTGAAIIQNINIGKNVIIGAGAVIIEDVPDKATVVGNPGRIINR